MICALSLSSGTKQANPKGCRAHAPQRSWPPRCNCSVWGNAQTHKACNWCRCRCSTSLAMQVCITVPDFIGGTQVVMTRLGSQRWAAQLIENHGHFTSWRNICHRWWTCSPTRINRRKLQPEPASRPIGVRRAMPRRRSKKLSSRPPGVRRGLTGCPETSAPPHMIPNHAPKPQCLGVPIHGVIHG